MSQNLSEKQEGILVPFAAHRDARLRERFFGQALTDFLAE